MKNALFFKSLLLLVSCFIFFRSHSQTPKEALQKLGALYPDEKIFVHFDKQNYMAGETMWFKAYLMSGFAPSALSTSIKVEIINDSGRITDSKILPVMQGTAAGNFDLDEKTRQSNYTIRAYTRWMMNFSDDHFYQHSFTIYNPSGANTQSLFAKPEPQINFFAEGGNLVANVNNVVAFKATNQSGQPMQLEGTLLNSHGSVIVSFESSYDGMGKFEFTPVPNESYTASCIVEKNVLKSIPLPVVSRYGITLNLQKDARGKVFIINRESVDDADFDPDYIIGTVEQNIVFQTSLPHGKKTLRGVIPIKDLPSGILQVTVFDKNHRPLAERLTFINNGEYILKGTFKSDTAAVNYRAKNLFTFTLADTLQGTYSAAVTNVDKELGDKNSDNIISAFLLSGDIKGYIHNPLYYFENNEEIRKDHLELVLLTNGWRRFSWDRILKNDLPAIKYRDANYITLKGTAFKGNSKATLSDVELNVIVKTKDSATNFMTLPLGNDGKFEMEGLIFEDTAHIYFQNNAKKIKDKEVTLNVQSASLSALLHTDVDRWSDKVKSFYPVTPISRELYQIFGTAGKDAVYLGEVIVQSRKKTPTQQLEERYTRGAFTMQAAKTVDLVNDPPASGSFSNVFDYIRGRIVGVNVIRSGNTYMLNYRNTRSLASGPVPMLIYLDEVLSDPSAIATMPVNQLAMIKVYSAGFVGGEGNSPGGAMAIYTKKSGDMSFGDGYTNMNKIAAEGYSIVKEFFSPAYENSKEQYKQADLRSTLYWNPYLTTDNDNLQIKIPFYNSDNAKKFRIVLQGITTDGRLVSVEKVIE